MSVYQNPTYYKGPLLEEKTVRAKASQTWQAGQFARMTDSGLVKVKSNGSSIQYLTAKTQATATSANEEVEVYKIPSTETQLLIGVTKANADTRALVGMIGSNYGVAVNSCICTLSTGNDSTEVLHVEDIYCDKMKYRGTDTGDLPGFAIVSIPAAVLTVEGDGM